MPDNAINKLRHIRLSCKSSQFSFRSVRTPLKIQLDGIGDGGDPSKALVLMKMTISVVTARSIKLDTPKL